MIIYDVFRRYHVARLVGHLRGFKPQDELTELPVHSVVHHLDFPAPGELASPVPDTDHWLWQLQPASKILTYQDQFLTGDGMLYPDLDPLIKPPTKMVTRERQAFRREHATFVRFHKDVDTLFTRMNWQAVISYNRLFDYRIYGLLAGYRKFIQIFTTVFNRIALMPDKEHFIPIPLGDKPFGRQAFERAFRVINRSSVKYPNSYHYMFMLHLLAYVHPDAATSIFDQIPLALRHKIHFVVHRDGRQVIYNLGLLGQFGEQVNGLVVILMKQLNLLAVGGKIINQKQIDQAEEKVEFAEPEGEADATYQEPLTKQKVAQRQDTNPDIEVDEDGDDTPDPTREVAAPIPTVPSKSLFTPTVAPVERVTATPVAKVSPVRALTDDTTEEEPETPVEAPPTVAPGDELSKVDNTPGGKMNMPSFRQDPPADAIKHSYREYLTTTVANAPETVIETTDRELTPGQKKRIRTIGQAFRSIKLGPGDKTLAELAVEIPPPVVPSQVDPSQVDLIDDSMRQSRVVKFDEQYLTHGLDSDIARVLLSFNTQGMFVVKVTQRDQLDPMNRVRHYSVLYEDIKHERHTIKFSFPIPDESGNCLVGGNTLHFKKQRINLPFVKSSSTRVSLATNFNKTLVERVSKVARDFFPYLSRLLEKGEFSLVRGGSPDSENYPTIAFAASDTNAVRTLYQAEKIIHTLRYGAERERLAEQLPLQYLNTEFGPVRVAEYRELKSLAEYPFQKTLSAERAKLYREAGPLLMLTLEPVSPHIRKPFEYSELEARLTSISKDKLYWHFRYGRRFLGLDPELQTQLMNLESTYGVYFGTMTGSDACFMHVDGRMAIVDPASNKLLRVTTLLDEVCRVGEVQSAPLLDHCELKILNKALPVGFILSYRYGLEGMLKYMGVKYLLVDKGKRIPPGVPATAAKLRFADRTLIINRAPTVPFLIFSGLGIFNLRDIMFEDMEDPITYLRLIQQLKLSVHYLSGVDSFFDLFIDPISAEVLLRMGEPTNVRDLLIRAVTVLSTTDHVESGATVNSRIRSYERLPGILYNEMARALANYKHRGVGAGNTFSLPPTAVLMRTVTDQLMDNVDVINPIHDIKLVTGVSHAGDGGRSDQTFTIEDRRFPADTLGVISEATVDSGKVAINVLTSMDPALHNLRGMATGRTPAEVTPTETLSVTSLLFPGATNDDGKRANFISIQSTHVVGTEVSDVFRVGTGYEKIMAHRTRPPFAYAAKEDGKILQVDDRLGLVKIEYKNGTTETVKIGESLMANTSSGFYMNQEMVLNGFKAGQRFRKDDVLAYNTRFFSPLYGTKQVAYKIGTTATVALVECDTTLEDSSDITRELSEKMAFAPIHTREISIPKTTTVREIVKPGDHVTSVTPLLVFDESPLELSHADKEIVELLKRLNRAAPSAKSAGEILRIECFHTCPFEEMDPSVAALVKKYRARQTDIRKFAEGSGNEELFIRDSQLAKDSVDRVGRGYLDAETVVIRFYIAHRVPLLGGSKIIYGSSLKSIVAQIMEEPIVTKSGRKVDARMSYRSMTARIINSPKYMGVASALLEQAEQEIIKIWRS